ncbi:MAG: carboxypeptidase regulatory-like domain-containing protein [Pirellulales bacterium]|nr:carboxypeptidase regulatory-like domain-containing protein [Pirellulales bacterium]
MRFAIILFPIFFLAPRTSAHEVHVTATVEGKIIRGKAYYHGGVPVREGEVQALDPLGEVLAEAKTDQEGKFTLPLTVRCDYRVLVDAGGGHGGEAFVDAGSLPAHEGRPPDERPHAAHSHSALHADDSSLAEEIHDLHHQIAQLQEAFDRYETRRRLSDVLGGVGYIFGLAGVAMYFLSLRKKKG